MLTILTVDDSKVIRKIVHRAFENHDCSVFEGDNGQMGVELAVQVKPDIIILDIDMPVMNGWDALACIRFTDELRETPVIMLTANAGERNEERAKKLGCVDFMAKPFQPGDLVAHVRKVIDF